jgi:hypothetical protein
VPDGFADSRAADPLADRAAARDSINGRNRPRCPECGVIAAIRQIGPSHGAIAANAVTGMRYEITIRFRDGSTTVFNEASFRNWRAGDRVIVIGGSTTSSN